MEDLRPIVPSCELFKTIRLSRTRVLVSISVVVQEVGAHKVLVYLNIPELRVKRSFPNLLKEKPQNGTQRTVEFQLQ
jgi:hypothetical protein